MNATTPVRRRLLVLLSASPLLGPGCSTNDDVFCEPEEVAVLTTSDTSLGFSADAILARIESQRWDITWDSIHEYAAPGFDQVDTALSLSGEDVFHMRGDADETCQIDGDYLRIPVTWTVASTDGTFRATGDGAVNATADADDQVSLGVDADDAEGAPPELEAALAAGAKERGGTAPTLRVHMRDSYAAPRLSMDGYLDEETVVATYGLAGGDLSPTP